MLAAAMAFAMTGSVISTGIIPVKEEVVAAAVGITHDSKASAGTTDDYYLDDVSIKETKFLKFNSLTFGNELKPDYNMGYTSEEATDTNLPFVIDTSAKEMLDWAKENSIPVRGHVLVWHSQCPDAIFCKNYKTVYIDENKKTLDSACYVGREIMLQRLESYIDNTMKYMYENGYADTIYAWDVVNEAVEPGTNQYNLRNSYWYQTIGEVMNEVNNGVNLTSVTIWGLTDDNSWKKESSPVLFRSDLSKKMAFDGIGYALTGQEMPAPAYVAPDFTDMNMDFETESDVEGFGPRGDGNVTVQSDVVYKGTSALLDSGRTASWNGASFDISRFLGQTIAVSAWVKSDATSVGLSAHIASPRGVGHMPVVAVTDTQSHNGGHSYSVKRSAQDANMSFDVSKYIGQNVAVKAYVKTTDKRVLTIPNKIINRKVIEIGNPVGNLMGCRFYLIGG